MFIPSENGGQGDGRTVEDALAAKSDAAWERGFLKTTRKRLICCSICKLHCFVTWCFVPYLAIFIIDNRCKWLVRASVPAKLCALDVVASYCCAGRRLPGATVLDELSGPFLL
eukprot:COSAG05_NODE_3894_length_1784_cov_1.566172_2_plen_113_part_00